MDGDLNSAEINLNDILTGGVMQDKLCLGRTDELAELLQRGSCTMAFQPVVELRSEKIYGFEALLRGVNGFSFLSPGFLFTQGYLTSESLLRLDTACIGSALRLGRNLAEKNCLFINIQLGTLRHLSMHPDGFLHLLDKLRINPGNIVLEISERTDLSFAVEVERHLRDFVKFGIQVAIDDIGGSFNWLHNMLDIKPSYLKVDKAFICEINSSRRKHALVQSLNIMCGTMGLHMIAEGIESPLQAKVLNEIGVTLAQGFWFGRHLSAEEWRWK